MTYQLYDHRIGIYFGGTQRMTEADALLLNRDLLLSGERGIGWKAVETHEPKARPRRQPKPAAPTPPDGLVDALVSLGYRKSDAKREAARFDGGTIEDALRQIMVAA